MMNWADHEDEPRPERKPLPVWVEIVLGLLTAVALAGALRLIFRVGGA